MSDSTSERAALAADVEAALFARGAVRRGRHLRVRCPAPGHDDVRPSCDVDLERGWVCRSCGGGGGLHALAELLRVTAPRPDPSPRVHRWRPRVPIPPPGIAWADWVPAWLAILEGARRQERRLAPLREVFHIGDWLRPRHQAVTAARRRASALGVADPRAWRLLVLAARVETETAVLDAELDAVRRYVA